MRSFLLVAAILLPVALQNAVPQKHAETAHADAHPGDNSNINAPGTQVVRIGGPRPISKVEENAKTSTGDNGTPKWWNRPTITDWILAVTTLAYVFVTYFMLKAIKRQSAATMDADCALILIKWDNIIHVNPDRPNELSHCFQWTFKNGGKTPAFIQGVQSRFIVVDKLHDLPPSPVYLKPKEMSYESEPLLPDERFPTNIYSPVESVRPYSELESCHRYKKCFLYAYGLVTYLDVYGRQQETRFGLVYDSAERMNRDNDGFRIAGPPSYNRYKKGKH